MSLVGFRAQNHPQQQTKDAVDDRGTTPEMFGPLNDRFGFTLDVAASDANTKCEDYYTLADDGLLQPWNGRVWCNPPYSNIEPWLIKAWDEWLQPPGLGPELIVMLLPANRTEQGWWQRQVEAWLRERLADFHVEFLAGRPRFIRPGAVIGPKGDRPPFGCCLLIWSDRHR